MISNTMQQWGRWEEFKDTATLYDIYQSPLCQIEKISFNLHFPPGELYHDNNGNPSKALCNWTNLNDLSDKINSFHLWGNAMYTADRYWAGDKNYIRNTFEHVFDKAPVKITSRQLDDVMAQYQHENIFTIANILLKVFGVELCKVKKSMIQS